MGISAAPKLRSSRLKRAPGLKLPLITHEEARGKVMFINRYELSKCACISGEKEINDDDEEGGDPVPG